MQTATFYSDKDHLCHAGRCPFTTSKVIFSTPGSGFCVANGYSAELKYVRSLIDAGLNPPAVILFHDFKLS